MLRSLAASFLVLALARAAAATTFGEPADFGETFADRGELPAGTTLLTGGIGDWTPRGDLPL